MAKQASIGPAGLVGSLSELADTTRVRLLHLLNGEEQGVTELCKAMQLPQSTVSRHLKVLSAAGWVAHRRCGTSNLYALHQMGWNASQAELWEFVSRFSASWAEVKQDKARLSQVLNMQNARRFHVGSVQEWQKAREDFYGRQYVLEVMAALVPKKSNVVDLGCSEGTMLSLFGRHGVSITGVDNNSQMLEAAREAVKDLPTVNVVEGSIEQLPLKDRAFDVALMVLLLAWLDHPEVALAEAARVLDEDGTLLLVDMLDHQREDLPRQLNQLHAGFSRSQLDRMCEHADLKVTHYQQLPVDSAAKGPALFLALLAHA